MFNFIFSFENVDNQEFANFNDNSFQDHIPTVIYSFTI